VDPHYANIANDEKEKAVELALRAVCSQMETVENETNKQPLSLKFLYMYSIHYPFF
jgi:hypothetical protein